METVSCLGNKKIKTGRGDINFIFSCICYRTERFTIHSLHALVRKYCFHDTTHIVKPLYKVLSLYHAIENTANQNTGKPFPPKTPTASRKTLCLKVFDCALKFNKVSELA